MTTKNNHWKGRDMLKSLGLAAVAMPFAGKASNSDSEGIGIPLKKRSDKKLKEPVKVIVIGAGNRGWGAYSSYGLKFPEEFQVVGVAEPIPYR